MTATVTLRSDRSKSNARGWAMACVVLAVTASTAGAQAATAAPSGPGAAQAQSAVPVLTRAQIDALLATPDKALFLDVRRADEVGTIGGFPAYLSIQAADLDRLLAYVPRDRQIVTVSNHAGRAKTTAALLLSKGYRVVGAAGVQDYEAQGGVLVGKKPPAQATAAAAAARPSN